MASLKMGKPQPLFVYFRTFQVIYWLKALDLSKIRTQIFRREGEHADHLTTTQWTLLMLI